VEYLRRGDTYYNEANTFKQDAYNLVNTRIGCKKEDFDIYFYINNIFDKEYYTYLLSFPPAVTTGSIGDPQTFGVQARIFF
jgi:iron complex outermembrane receptor protein